MKSFLKEVCVGLSKKNKKLSYKWFYDFKRSKLFEEITKLKEYYPARTERKILRDNKKEIIVCILFFIILTVIIEVIFMIEEAISTLSLSHLLSEM